MEDQIAEISLKTSNNVIIKAKLDIIMCSGVIKQMLENCPTGDKDSVVPLPNIRSDILHKILSWAEHHKNDERIVDRRDINRSSTQISDWDKQFLNVDQNTLCQIINAANYLDIPRLVDTGCKTVANMIRGKTTAQMREILHIENDLSKEEEKNIAFENQWIEENYDYSNQFPNQFPSPF